jgi:hypothetical protein
MKMTKELRYFKVDKSRHALVAAVRFYQADLRGVMDIAREVDPDLFMDNGIYLPSWAKYGADPIRAKGFFVTMLQGIFEGKHGLDSINADLQTRRRTNRGPKVAMLFLPASMKNPDFALACQHATDALRGFAVMAIYGGEGGMKNATAEKEANDFVDAALKQGKSVLLVTRTMANRSFSVKHITEIYLAYDEGDNGATIQKMSRGLTPHNADKVCSVFSLSFDPNRDDKFDRIIMTAADNYARKHNVRMSDALDMVLRTVDVLKCLPNGAVPMVRDEYLGQLMQGNRLARTIGRICNFEHASADMIAAFAASDLKAFREAKQAVAQKGKTRLVSLKRKNGAKPKDIDANLLQRAREAIVNITEHLDVILWGTKAKTLDEAFVNMSKDLKLEHDIEKKLNISVGLVKEAIECGLINKNLLSLMESML